MGEMASDRTTKSYGLDKFEQHSAQIIRFFNHSGSFRLNSYCPPVPRLAFTRSAHSRRFSANKNVVAITTMSRCSNILTRHLKAAYTLS